MNIRFSKKVLLNFLFTCRTSKNINNLSTNPTDNINNSNNFLQVFNNNDNETFSVNNRTNVSECYNGNNITSNNYQQSNQNSFNMFSYKVEDILQSNNQGPDLTDSISDFACFNTNIDDKDHLYKTPIEIFNGGIIKKPKKNRIIHTKNLDKITKYLDSDFKDLAYELELNTSEIKKFEDCKLKYNNHLFKNNIYTPIEHRFILYEMLYLVYFYKHFSNNDFNMLGYIISYLNPILNTNCDHSTNIKINEIIDYLSIKKFKRNITTEYKNCFNQLIEIIEKSLYLLRMPVEYNPILKIRNLIDLKSFNSYFYCLSLIVMNKRYFFSFRSVILKIEQICSKYYNQEFNNYIKSIIREISSSISYRMCKFYVPVFLNSIDSDKNIINSRKYNNMYIRMYFNKRLEEILNTIGNRNSKEAMLLIANFQSLYSHYFLLQSILIIFNDLNDDKDHKTYQLFYRELLTILLAEIYIPVDKD